MPVQPAPTTIIVPALDDPPMPLPTLPPPRVAIPRNPAEPLTIKPSGPAVPPKRIEPRPGEERKVAVAAGVNMVVCWVPAGRVTLGSPKGEIGRRADEIEHQFETRGFWLGKYPVTQAEWMAVMGENPSCFDGKNNNEARGLDTSRFPVEQVNWDDCQKFLERSNQNRGKGGIASEGGRFVLPHEDQWEYACRGGQGNNRAFYFGNELNGIQANCNGDFPYRMDRKGENKERTTEVGRYAERWPHPWGLCDMHGNVYQWCANRYEGHASAYSLRGGAWLAVARDCRAAARRWNEPELRTNFMGLRVCLVPEE